MRIKGVKENLLNQETTLINCTSYWYPLCFTSCVKKLNCLIVNAYQRPIRGRGSMHGLSSVEIAVSKDNNW